MIQLAIFILGLNLVFSQNIAERFLVPVYYELRTSSGYDSNLFLYSNNEMNSMSLISPEMVSVPYYDSGKLKPEIKLTYIPQLINGIETRLYGSFGYTIYPQVSIKNYQSYSGKIGFYFDAYHSVKIGYSYIPDFFLRRYADLDLTDTPVKDCAFSKSNSFLSYTHPLKNRNWIKFQFNQTQYFFNSHFTEFDTEVNQLKLLGSLGLKNRIRSTIQIGFAEGKNTTYNNGLITTDFDRSYKMLSTRLGFKTGKLFDNQLEFFRVTSEIKKRWFLSESPDDLLHNGRNHIEYKFNFTIGKKLSSKILLESYLNLRNRETHSSYEFVEELKSFQKIETGLRLIFKGYLDIYY